MHNCTLHIIKDFSLLRLSFPGGPTVLFILLRLSNLHYKVSCYKCCSCTKFRGTETYRLKGNMQGLKGRVSGVFLLEAMTSLTYRNPMLSKIETFSPLFHVHLWPISELPCRTFVWRTFLVHFHFDLGSCTMLECISSKQVWLSFRCNTSAAVVCWFHLTTVNLCRYKHSGIHMRLELD